MINPANLADAGNADGDFSGNQFAFSPEHAATLAVRFETLVTDQMNFIAELNGAYQSKRYLTDGNNAYMPAHDIWDIQAGVDTESWRVLFYVENMFDDDSVRSAVSNTDFGNFIVSFPSGSPGPQIELPRAANIRLPQPRTVGARFSYRF